MDTDPRGQTVTGADKSGDTSPSTCVLINLCGLWVGPALQTLTQVTPPLDLLSNTLLIPNISRKRSVRAQIRSRNMLSPDTCFPCGFYFLTRTISYIWRATQSVACWTTPSGAVQTVRLHAQLPSSFLHRSHIVSCFMRFVQYTRSLYFQVKDKEGVLGGKFNTF